MIPFTINQSQHAATGQAVSKQAVKFWSAVFLIKLVVLVLAVATVIIIYKLK